MKNVLEISNVKNLVTNERGSLFMYLNKYSKSAWEQRGENPSSYDSANLGLNIFFKPEGKEEPMYIKSFVLTAPEVKLMSEGKVNIIEDLGYILAWGMYTLRIYDMGSYDTQNGDIKENGCQIVECGVHKFEMKNQCNSCIKLLCDTYNNTSSNLCDCYLNEYTATIYRD